VIEKHEASVRSRAPIKHYMRREPMQGTVLHVEWPGSICLWRHYWNTLLALEIKKKDLVTMTFIIVVKWRKCLQRVGNSCLQFRSTCIN